MRERATGQSVLRFLEALARHVSTPTTIFLVGGTSAVIEGWRESTMDLDVVFRPETDAVLRAIPALKERLHLNVELASPDQFIPIPAGWESRSPEVRRFAQLRVCHFDFTAQALAKIERGHARDLEDVAAMRTRGLVTVDGLREAFATIEPELYRFPSIDPDTFRRALHDTLAR